MTVIGTGRTLAPSVSLGTSASSHVPVIVSSVRSWRTDYRRRVLLGDVLAVLVAACLVGGASAILSQSRPPRSELLAVGAPLAWLAIAWLLRAYQPECLGAGDEPFRRVTRTGIYLVAGGAVISALGAGAVALGDLVAFSALATGLSLSTRCVLRARLRRSRASGRCLDRTLVVCHDDALRRIRENAEEMAKDGLSIVAACLPHDARRVSLLHSNVAVVGDFRDIVGSARQVAADVVAVTACAELDEVALRQLRWGLAGEGRDLVLLATLSPLNGRVYDGENSGLRTLHVARPELRGLPRSLKTVFDRVIAGAALLVLWPLLLALALLVRATSPGSGFFR